VAAGYQREHERAAAQYFPERTNLSIHSADDLRAVEERLNNRPRKALDWRTPAEIFTAALTS
jgi:IS30 family transposase